MFKKLINKIRYQYYMKTGLMYQLSMEQAQGTGDTKGAEYWANKYNRCLNEIEKLN